MTDDMTAEAHRMIGQIDAKNVPILDWNARVKTLAQAYINLSGRAPSDTYASPSTCNNKS
jgi:hypothetical protein